jgi:hypothetical protein
MKIPSWRQFGDSDIPKVSAEKIGENGLADESPSLLKKVLTRLKQPLRLVKNVLFPKFEEPDFREGFFKTYAERGADGATKYLIERAPEMLHSKLSRQEKLNHLLYMSRMIQNSGTTKYGIVKVSRKAKTIWRIWKKWGLAELGTYVDFGAGTHDPIGMATFMHGAGFKRAIANDQRKPRCATYSALSLLEILSMVRLRPDKYLPKGVESESFLERIAGFDLDALAEYDFMGGIAPLKGRVDYAVCDIVEADIAEREASLIVSYAVFEHVTDVPGVLDFLYSRTAPGGVGFHFIDLRDHRAHFKDSKYNEFSFLCEETAPKSENRLRCSEHVAAFTKAGFEILKVDADRHPFPEEMRSRLMPHFAEMAQDDLETLGVTLVVRRPM